MANWACVSPHSSSTTQMRKLSAHKPMLDGVEREGELRRGERRAVERDSCHGPSPPAERSARGAPRVALMAGGWQKWGGESTGM